MKKAILLASFSLFSVFSFSQILNSDFELGSNGDWTEGSSNFGVVICNPADCGFGMGDATPRSGTHWVWFCGLDGGPGDIIPEVSELSQSFVIPTGSSAEIELWVYIAEWPGALGPDDNTVFMVDGDTLWEIKSSDSASYNQEYTKVSLDVTSLADSMTHTLKVVGTQNTWSPWPFLIDDVNLFVDGQLISIFEDPDMVSVRVFPNPCSDFLNMDLSSIQGETEISIVDIQGRTLLSFVHNSSEYPSTKIDLRTLSEGTYFYQVKSNSGIEKGSFSIAK